MSGWRVASLPLIAACGHPSGLEDIEVESARLESVSHFTIAVVAGAVFGDAELVIVDPFWGELAYPVEIGGPVVGAGFQMDGNLDFGSGIDFDLSETDGTLTGNDLLGSYNGMGQSFALGIGFDHYTLENRADVKIDQGWFALGVSAMAGAEWMTIRLDDGTDPEP